MPAIAIFGVCLKTSHIITLVVQLQTKYVSIISMPSPQLDKHLQQHALSNKSR